MGRPTDLLRTEEKRKEFTSRARAGILRYMELRNVDEETLAAKQGVTRRTIQNRIESPGKMQLEDIWEMAIIMKCPLGELCGGELPEELIGEWLSMAKPK